MFLDGYVTLHDNITPKQTPADVSSATTIMRWAQVFATTEGSNTKYSTGGETTLNADSGKEITMTAIGNASDNTGKNLANIYGATGGPETVVSPSTGSGEGVVTFNNGNVMPVINRNYIRLSSNGTSTTYTRANLADALVFNQYLAANGVANLYFVVWMSENAQDQTLSGDAARGFFDGNVTFNSGSGGEVTATFSGFSRVTEPGTVQSGG